MDRDIALSKWQQAWVDRKENILYCASVGTVCVLSGIALLLALRTITRLRKCLQAMHDDPTSRAALHAECNKKTLESLRKQFLISVMYIAEALAIWIIDAAIGVLAIWNDASEVPDAYDTNVWLDIAIQAVSMLAIFVAVFIMFPMAQLMLFSWAYSRSRRNRSSTSTISALIPEARILSTQLMQLWSMLGFLLVAFWPVFTQTRARLLLAEAVFGSAMAWGHVSFMLNWRHEELADVAGSNMVLLCGRKALTMYTREAEEASLPKFAGEKQALLAGDNQ